MAGFRKAKAEQSALKMGMYGPPGSGKTLTSLLIAEGLAAISKKRVAYVDTERGTDFYCKAVKERLIHPAEFDFDALYTRSLIEALNAVKALKPAEYDVVVIDSITHLWEAAIAAYSGKQTSIGSIPMNAWGKIKKPYKELINYLLSSPMHVIFCGRQGTVFAEDPETEELKAVGLKMKAEGETPYEPHILIRMEVIRPTKTNEVAQVVAYAEKDRTGILSGRSFINPTFKSLCEPILYLLGGTQAHMASADESSAYDMEAIAQAEKAREEESATLLKQYRARIDLATTKKDLKSIGAEITPKLKSRMLPGDVSALREYYLDREKNIKEEEAPPKSAAVDEFYAEYDAAKEGDIPQ